MTTLTENEWNAYEVDGTIVLEGWNYHRFPEWEQEYKEIVKSFGIDTIDYFGDRLDPDAFLIFQRSLANKALNDFRTDN